MRHPGRLCLFHDTAPEVERFLGREAMAQPNFAEAGSQLPPEDAPVAVTLLGVNVTTMFVRQCRSEIERLWPKRVGVLRLSGAGFKWLVPEDGYEGSWWEVANHRLKVSAGVGAFVLEVDKQLQLEDRSWPVPAHGYRRRVATPAPQRWLGRPSSETNDLRRS